MKKVLALLISAIVLFSQPDSFFAADNEISGEITVSCYDTMTHKSILEYAAKAFEKKYPGTKVNVSTFSAMPVIKTSVTDEGSVVSVSEHESDPKKEEDYLSRINTEMMSGGGADIFAVDVIPYYKYVDAGQLEDLRKFMDTDDDFDYDDYQKNIFDAAMYKDGQYILPTDYYFNCLSYDSTLMDKDMQDQFDFTKYTYEKLVEMGYDSFMNQFDAGTEAPAKFFNLYSNEGDELGGTFFQELLNSNYGDLIDITNKKAYFTDGRFVNMLNTSKEYSEKGYLYTQINYEEMLREGINIADLASLQSTDRTLYKLTNYIMLLYSMVEDPNNMFGGIGLDTISEDDILIGLISNDKGESTFSSTRTYAMNSNSKNKQTAWEFLKFLLSDDIQGSFSISFAPVNKNAADQKTKLTIASIMPSQDNAATLYESTSAEESTAADTNISSDTDNADMDTSVDAYNAAEDYDIYAALDEMAGYSYFDSDVTLTEKQQAVFDKYMDYMDRYTALLNSYVVSDTVISEMISKEVQSFFKGTKTADEVAAILQSRVNMYLQE